MAGSVTRCIDEHHGAITEHVQIFLHQVHRMFLRKSGPRVGGWLGDALLAFGEVIVILGLLNEEWHLRKHFGVADVIGVSVGNSHVLDVRRFHADVMPIGCDSSVLARVRVDVRRWIIRGVPAVRAWRRPHQEIPVSQRK